MQLFAWDCRCFLVSAEKAAQGLDYFCPECGGRLRVRGGCHTKKHFFHMAGGDYCRQSGKSACHLMTQLWLQRRIGKNDLALELPFPAVRRIADAVWFREKLIFEVQCSPISVDEVEARIADYASQGYQVIWVLHDGLFNQDRGSMAERYLAMRWRYFSCVDDRGRGCVYDQLDWFERERRLGKVGPFPVEFEVKRVDTAMLPRHWRGFFERRLWASGRCLKGDVLALVSGWIRDEFDKRRLANVEVALLGWKGRMVRARRKMIVGGVWKLFKLCVITPYRVLFQILLEKACH